MATLTIDDAISILTEISKKGKGGYPLQLMETGSGMTYACDVEITEAQEYDGDRVWIYATDKHPPEWLANGIPDDKES